MLRNREEILRRIHERVSMVSSWLAARGAAGDRDVEPLRVQLESVRREIQKEVTESADDALARARATMEDMERDGGPPAPPAALRREELQALRRHLQLTATLLPRLSNLDHPGWDSAHAEYQRSWAEVARAFAGPRLDREREQ